MKVGDQDRGGDSGRFYLCQGNVVVQEGHMTFLDFFTEEVPSYRLRKLKGIPYIKSKETTGLTKSELVEINFVPKGPTYTAMG